LATAVAVNGVSHNGNGNGHHDPEDRTWPEMFEWFWGEFPKKVGKPGARRAWMAVRPQNQATIDAMTTGLDRWCPVWASKNKEFTPHPATFLNQRRWEDMP
jgi:hypothetical protein